MQSDTVRCNSMQKIVLPGNGYFALHSATDFPQITRCQWVRRNTKLDRNLPKLHRRTYNGPVESCCPVWYFDVLVAYYPHNRILQKPLPVKSIYSFTNMFVIVQQRLALLAYLQTVLVGLRLRRLLASHGLIIRLAQSYHSMLTVLSPCNTS